MKFTYLLIDILAMLVPFIFSFHPKLRFYKAWPAVWPAIAVSAIVFLLWDAYFTQIKVWGFNPAYVIGIYAGNLPVEEVLFFICIPYSCMFTFYCLNNYLQKAITPKGIKPVTAVLIVLLLITAAICHAKLYTACTFVFLSAELFVAQFVLKVAWLPNFYITYLVLLLPFVIVNGLLTGTGLAHPVVWYNDSQNLGIRLLTIPFEDIFYGMSLILLNVMLYTRLYTHKNLIITPVIKN